MLKKQVITEPKNLNRNYLNESLSHHKNIFSRYTYEYLECLINLDISILKAGYITEEEMQYLMQLGLVQSIAKYNLYEKAYKIFEDDSKDYNIVISSKDDKKGFLKVLGIDREEQFVIFDYQALKDLMNINLYHILESPTNREKEISRLNTHIDDLYANQIEYLRNSNGKSLQEQIREYQTIRHELMERTNLSGTKYEILNHFNNRILEDYGFSFGQISPKLATSKPNGNMETTLTKSYSHINLNQNIKYF